MKNILTLSLIFGAANLFAANVTNLPPIADKPWVTNLLRSSSALATNTPSSGQVLTSNGTTNYWATPSGGSGTLAYGLMEFGSFNGSYLYSHGTNVTIDTANGKFTILYSGIYEIHSQGNHYSTNAASAIWIRVNTNGMTASEDNLTNSMRTAFSFNYITNLSVGAVVDQIRSNSVAPYSSTVLGLYSLSIKKIN